MPDARLPRWLIWRGGKIHYKRAVPTEFLPFVEQKVVRISLKTADLAKAVVARDKVNAETERYWRALANGAGAKGQKRYLAAIDRARMEGFGYKPLDSLREDALEEAMRRIEALEAKLDVAGPPAPTINEAQLVDALLGAVEEPQTHLSDLVETYEGLTRDERRLKSDAQLHKWRLPHARAQRNIVEVIGDKPIAAFTRGDALAFRAWWSDRIEEEDLSPESANKDFTHIGKMIAVVSDRYDLDLPRRFRGLLFDSGTRKRAAFTTGHLQKAFLKSGALAKLNADARAVVMVMMELGARPSEIAGLRPRDVHLEDEVPHISIESYKGRVLKTRYSQRTLPLVGIALVGAKLIREGANGYHDRSGALSATIGKFIEEAQLAEGEARSAYCLRHSFKDRLTEAGAPDIIDTTLMGHKFDRPDYGSGPTLKLKLKWLQKTRISGDEG